MTVFTITLEEIATGRRSPSMVTRQATEAAAREYAENAIIQASKQNELRVAEIVART